MTKLIVRLIMASLLLPLGGLLFAVLIATTSLFNPGPSILPLVLVWLVEYLFIGTYWVLLWKPIINWTPARIKGTVIATILALGTGVLFGGLLLISSGDVDVGIGLGGIAPLVSFLLFTIWVWREKEQERLERLSRSEGTLIECAGCGYDMRGLRTTSCPECGASPTLHQLMAGQGGWDSHEISQHETPQNP